jgi:hypothetical protein
MGTIMHTTGDIHKPYRFVVTCLSLPNQTVVCFSSFPVVQTFLVHVDSLRSYHSLTLTQACSIDQHPDFAKQGLASAITILDTIQNAYWLHWHPNT